MSREMNVLPCFSLLGHEPRSALPFLVPWLFGHQPFWKYVFLWSHFSASRFSRISDAFQFTSRWSAGPPPVRLRPFGVWMTTQARETSPRSAGAIPGRGTVCYWPCPASKAFGGIDWWWIGAASNSPTGSKEAHQTSRGQQAGGGPKVVYSNLHGITCEKPNLLLRVSPTKFFAAIEWQKQKRRARAWNQNKNIYTVQEK